MPCFSLCMIQFRLDLIPPVLWYIHQFNVLFKPYQAELFSESWPVRCLHTDEICSWVQVVHFNDYGVDLRRRALYLVNVIQKKFMSSTKCIMKIGRKTHGAVYWFFFCLWIIRRMIQVRVLEDVVHQVAGWPDEFQWRSHWQWSGAENGTSANVAHVSGWPRRHMQ